jgi:cell division septum initiation protein DivIVA
MDYENLSDSQLIAILDKLSEGKKWERPCDELISRLHAEAAKVYDLDVENKKLKNIQKNYAQLMTEARNKEQQLKNKIESQAQTIKYLVSVADLLTAEVPLDS